MVGILQKVCKNSGYFLLGAVDFYKKAENPLYNRWECKRLYRGYYSGFVYKVQKIWTERLDRAKSVGKECRALRYPVFCKAYCSVLPGRTRCTI